MATKGISGPGLAMVAGGAYIIYLGIKGADFLAELRSLAKGQKPSPLSRESSAKGLQGPPSNDLGGPGGDFGGGKFGGFVEGSSASGRDIANAALSHVGVPYKWGGASPSGFDCSGLVYYVFTREVGVPAKGFPRSTAAEIVSPLFHRVSRREITAGDLTWWPGHVGIAINNSEGVYAPSTGRKVQVQQIDRPRPGFIGLRYFGPGIRYAQGGRP
jgi:hypothetical protein